MHRLAVLYMLAHLQKSGSKNIIVSSRKVTLERSLITVVAYTLYCKSKTVKISNKHVKKINSFMRNEYYKTITFQLQFHQSVSANICSIYLFFMIQLRYSCIFPTATPNAVTTPCGNEHITLHV